MQTLMRCGILGICLSVAMGATSSSFAQAFPSKPIRISYPAAAGSGADGHMRLISSEAAKVLGQPVVYENVNGRAGLAAISASAPDGYSLTYGNDFILVTQPVANAKYRFDLDHDYVPVALSLQFPLVLSAHPGVPYRDVKGLIAYGKANPGKINFAYTPGSVTHGVTAMFLQRGGVEATLVPYKGGGPATIDLLAGRVDLLWLGGAVKQHVDAGKLIAIGTTAGERFAPLMSVPTLTEGGLPIVATTWFGVIAHPRTPGDVVMKLNAAFNAARKTAAVMKSETDSGYVPGRGLNPSDFGQFIKSEFDQWTPIIQKANIVID